MSATDKEPTAIPNAPNRRLEEMSEWADVIERLRCTGIRLDRAGRFWHEGAEMTHPGLRRAMLRWLDVADDGRSILRLDQERFAYIDVDDAHLLALSVRWRSDRAWLSLNDGSQEELNYPSVCVDGDSNALYCRVREGRLQARITTAAYYTLAERIEAAPVSASSGLGESSNLASAHPVDDESFVLRARGEIFVIGRRSER